jgi:gamma-glutamyl hercynylcysteine S-oxide synthase
MRAELTTPGTVAVNTRQASPSSAPSFPREVAAALLLLEQTRAATLALVSHLEARELERVHSPVMGPLVWDLAHIAAYEDLWLCHRHCGLELARPQLAHLYDAFETPRALRSEAQAGFLDTREAYSYMEQVQRRACQGLISSGIRDGTIFELVVRHELQHNETMRQTMNIAGLLPNGEPPTLKAIAGAAQAAAASAARRRTEPAEWLELEAGAFQMGAPAQGFAYDNERPRHTVELPAFAIATRPLTNGAWARFRDEGGYRRREWWSEQGWAWLQARQDRELPPRFALRDDADACLCHISWFEAEAMANANGARLPTEAEWEKAARASGTGAGDGVALAAAPAALAAVGLVWEWTSTVFSGFPGFRAHPYREYSEVFFDRGYRVLRGGSWATHRRVASASFRNWDLPERMQIFAGVRLARDL